MPALRTIIERDPNAYVGSRILLSLVDRGVPSFSDWGQLGWLSEIGYKRYMLCDELCLKEDLLGRAVNAFDCFRNEYSPRNGYSTKKEKPYKSRNPLKRFLMK